MIANIFQQLYNITNSMIVGNYVSKEALSAVSACTSILNIANFFFYGIATACGILTSTYFGAKDREKLNDVVQ
ncbi:MAG: MATE family efflux transporter, partial [Erysipelotrichaceae bacterium]|nr:MATE family efflux transporter [Erysipelotrichaceae bacterium]